MDDWPGGAWRNNSNWRARACNCVWIASKTEGPGITDTSAAIARTGGATGDKASAGSFLSRKSANSLSVVVSWSICRKETLTPNCFSMAWAAWPRNRESRPISMKLAEGPTSVRLTLDSS